MQFSHESMMGDRVPCFLTAVTAARSALVEYLVLVFLLYDRTKVILPSKCVFASNCSNNATIHLAPPFTRVARDLIVQSFIAPLHGICLEYKQM